MVRTKFVSRNIKWLVAASAILVMMATVPVVSAGHRWSGMDPQVIVNGEKINVWVEWDGNTCDIQAPIETVIVVPKGSDYTFIGESAEGFDCDHDGVIDARLATNTTIVEGRNANMFVSSKVNAPDRKFRTKVKIYRNNEIVNECRGFSNHWLKCKGPKF